jgi:hypothetical protein
VSEEAFRWLTGRDLPGEGYWRDKATAQRFELNAFALKDFVTWLEAKLRAHGFAEKVVPTPEVVTEKAQEVVSEAAVALAEEALRDLVDWERIVATAAQELTRGVSLLTEPELRSALADNPSTSCSRQGRIASEAAGATEGGVTGERGQQYPRSPSACRQPANGRTRPNPWCAQPNRR